MAIQDHDMQKRNVSSIKPAMESAATTTSEQEPKMPPIDLAYYNTMRGVAALAPTNIHDAPGRFSALAAGWDTEKGTVGNRLPRTSGPKPAWGIKLEFKQKVLAAKYQYDLEQAGVKFQSEVSEAEKRALLKDWDARQYHALESWRNASQANASQVDKEEASQ